MISNETYSKMAAKSSSTPELGETKSTISISMTPQIGVALRDAIDSGKLLPETREAANYVLSDSPQRMPYQLLEDICRQQHGASDYYRHLSLLLDGTKWYYADGPAPTPRDRSKESIVEQIRNDAAQRAYQRITLNVDGTTRSKGGEWSSVGRDLRQMTSELTAVINFLITVAAGFLFGYMASELLKPKRDLFANVLWGIVLAVIVGVADLYFLLRHMARSDAPPLTRQSQAINGTRSINSNKSTLLDRKLPAGSSARQIVEDKYKTQTAMRAGLLETKKEK